MNAMRELVVTRLRDALPEGSLARRMGSRTLHYNRVARRKVRENYANVVSRAATLGKTPYEIWLSQNEHDLPVYDGDRPVTKFLILVEEREGLGVAYPRFVLNEKITVDVVHLAGTASVPAIEFAEYDLVLVLREGTILAKSALSRLALKHYQNPIAVAITFDSDVVNLKGDRSSPLFRPEWSPQVLLGNNYVGRAVAFSAKWLAAQGGLQASRRGIWSKLLTISLSGAEVEHLPKVLMSEAPEGRDYVPNQSDAEMVEQLLKDAGQEAQVIPERCSLKVLFSHNYPPVSLIVPTRHSRENMERLVQSLKGTAYPRFEVIVMDNGGYSQENESWYEQLFEGISHTVNWWTETPFNYNKVNNEGARAGAGDVLVFLNDDTEIVNSDWLDLLVSHAIQPGIGTVGYQLIEGTGKIQHGGVMLGPGGFADNLFAGMAPEEDTLIGPTTWHRNVLAVTGACVAISRDNFNDVGGFDERFELMGSDVVLGLDQVLKNRNNLVLPFDRVRHFESLTRGSAVPESDLYASYWRYNPWLRNGDPYVSPNVSQLSAVPRFSSPDDPNPADVALAGLGRPVVKHAQGSNISAEATSLLETASANRSQVKALQDSHDAHRGEKPVKTVNWFIPEIDMPFFGGLNTAFRIANKLRTDNDVLNRFVVLGAPHEIFYRSALDAAFEGLGQSSEFVFYDGSEQSISAIPRADAAISTLWLTATHVVKAMSAPRNFYLVQDFEPEFYPASSMFALAEESYRYGLYGICNTRSMHETYVDAYRGKAMYFTPAVDRDIYYANSEALRSDECVTIFAYARDHFRNCWELVCEALTQVKREHGRGVRIVAAGARYLPDAADFVDMGLMDYRATGEVYRNTDIGVTMQISRHPSYLPLELMACGVPMVSPDSEWFKWLFKDGDNSATVMRSYVDLKEQISLLVNAPESRRSLSTGALDTIDGAHSDWDDALQDIYSYLCNPE